MDVVACAVIRDRLDSISSFRAKRRISVVFEMLRYAQDDILQRSRSLFGSTSPSANLLTTDQYLLVWQLVVG